MNACNALVEKNDFDVHLKDNDGWRTLHRSALSGTYELVSFFANMGADIYLKTNNGSICLNIEAVNEFFNLWKELVDKHHFDVHLKDND